jgi:uncharacterized membrane protein (DUF485 family)
MNSEVPAETGTVDESLLNNPDFRRLLARRSRLRWGFSSVLVATYVAWALAGVYAQDVLGTGFMESSLTWGFVIGYVIIASSIALSIVYIRIINRLYLTLTLTREESH